MRVPVNKVNKLIALAVGASGTAIAAELLKSNGAPGAAVAAGLLGSTGGAIAGVVSGVCQNLFSSLFQPSVEGDESPESLIKNHDLRLLVGLAIRDTLLLHADDADTVQRLAAGVPDFWMSEAVAADTSFSKLDESETATLFAHPSVDFRTLTALDEPTWRDFLTALAGATQTPLPEPLRDRLAIRLHDQLPGMIRAKVKQDFDGQTDAGGRGFASLHLVTMGKLLDGMKTLLERTLPPTVEQVELLERFQRVNAGIASRAAQHEKRLTPRERASLAKVIEQVHTLRPFIDRRIDEVLRAIADAERHAASRHRLQSRRLAWIGAGVAAILVLGFAATLWLRQKMKPDPFASALMQSAAEVGLDLDDLTAGDFSISVEPHALVGPNQGRLIVRVRSELDEVASQGCLEFRVGQRPWKMVYNDMKGGLYGMLDEKDFAAGQPVQLRLDTMPGVGVGTIFGPYQFDINVNNVLRKLQRETAASNTTWLSARGRSWRVDREFIQRVADLVKALRIGADPQNLTYRKELPSKPGAEASQEAGIYYTALLATFASTVDLQQFSNQDVLYGQLEFEDGTLGPVLTFRATDKPTK